jgi:hypothetical protein
VAPGWRRGGRGPTGKSIGAGALPSKGGMRRAVRLWLVSIRRRGRVHGVRSVYGRIWRIVYGRVSGNQLGVG